VFLTALKPDAVLDPAETQLVLIQSDVNAALLCPRVSAAAL